jgi:hypothetical protein
MYVSLCKLLWAIEYLNSFLQFLSFENEKAAGIAVCSRVQHKN